MSGSALDSVLDLSPLTPGPIPTSVSAACDSAAVIVRQTLALDMRRQEGSFKDSFRGEPRVGCRLVALGSFKALGTDFGPIDTLRAVLPRRGWAPDVRYEADGPDGSAIGMRKLETLCMIGGNWDGGDDSDTTTRAPTPEEDRYAVEVECVHDVPINSAEDVPDSIWGIARAAGFDSLFAFSGRMQYPPYVEGDFDGDGVNDAAVLVERRSTGKLGIIFIHRGSRRVLVAGAGTSVLDGPDDISWVNGWEVWHKGSTYDTVIGTGPSATLIGDALWVSSPDSAAFLYWNGSRYAWERAPKPETGPPSRVITGQQLRRPPR